MKCNPTSSNSPVIQLSPWITSPHISHVIFGLGKNAKTTFCSDPATSDLAVYIRSRPIGTSAPLCTSNASLCAWRKRSKSKTLANGFSMSGSKIRRVTSWARTTSQSGGSGVWKRLRSSQRRDHHGTQRLLHFDVLVRLDDTVIVQFSDTVSKNLNGTVLF